MVENNFKKLLTAILFFFMAVIFPVSDAAAEEALWDELGVYGGQIYTISVDPDDYLKLYAGSWNGDGFFISDDAGETWTSNGWFRNCVVYDIEIDPNDPQTIWVANGHQIDKSIDGGETWSFYTFPDGRFCYTVEVDPNDTTGQTVFVGTGPVTGASTGGTVFESYDGGDTWTPHDELASGFTTYCILDLDFNPSNRDVWVTSNTFNISDKSGIYVYTNENGDWGWWGWDQDFYMDEFLFHPTPSYETLFACGDGGVWKKTDGEALTGWDTSFSNEDFFARAMCVPPRDTDKIYVAMIEDSVTPVVIKGEYPWKSGEDLWSYTTSEAPDEFICLAADDFASPLYYLYAGGTNEGAFRSTDEGKTWESISKGMFANSIYDSDVSPEDSSTLLLGTLGGVYEKSGSVPVLLNDDTAYSVAYHPQYENTMFAGFGWGLSKSTDGGTNWNFFNPLSHGVSGYSGESYRVLSVAVTPDGGTVFAGVSMDVGNDGYVLKILDDGGVFSSSYFYYNYSETPVNSMAVHPGDSDIVFAGRGSFYAPVTEGGLNRSTDGGTTWPYISMGSSDDDVVVNDIAIEQQFPYTMYAACGGSDLSYSGIYKSTDNGSTWEKKTGGLPDNYAVTDIKIDPDDSNFVYASIYKGYDDDCTYSTCDDMNGVYVSYNAGEYWSPLGLSDYYMYDVNIYKTGSTSGSRTKEEGRSLSYPLGTVVGGSASGGYSTSMSTGRGTVSGFVKSKDTGEPIAKADIMSLTQSTSKCKTESTGFFQLSTATGTHRISVRANNFASSIKTNVRVSTGGLTPIGTIELQSGSPGPDPKPDSDSTCFLDAILGTSRSKELDPFRAFRDNVLGRTKYGKRLVDLYYRSGPEILTAVGKNPALKRKSLGIIERSIPLFKAISEKERATFSTEFLNEVSAFLFELENHVSPELKKTIYKLRLSIKRNDLFEKLSVKKQGQIEPNHKTIGPEKACRP